MERVWSLIVLNVLWLVCSLPVVTLGASCAALYQVLGKVIDGEDGHVAGGSSVHGVKTGKKPRRCG